MQSIEEPVPPSEQVLLRRLVLEHKARERRRQFAAVLHLGGAGRPEVGRVDESEDRLDDALRCELLAALLRRTTGPTPMAWLTRAGDLQVQDVDLSWMRAVATVSDQTALDLRYVVVTRAGWRDPRSGVGRTWVRLRQR